MNRQIDTGSSASGSGQDPTAGGAYVRGMERLVEVGKGLSLARDLETVMAIVRTAARELTGADGATFVLREGDLCFYAEEDAVAPLWKGRRFPSESCISGWSMQHHEAVTIENIYEDSRVPAEAYRPTFVKSLAMVPIRAADPIGAIGTYWATKYRPSKDQVRLLQALADLTSVAMENVARIGELRRKAEHDELLAKAASLLHQSLDYQETLSNVGHLLVPTIADWYAVDLVANDMVEQVAVAHVEPNKVGIAREVRSRFGLDLNAPRGAGKVIRTGEPDFGEVTDEILVASTRDEEHLRIARELRLKSFVTVPMTLHRRIIGALTLVTAEESGRVFREGDLELAKELARRCAVAIENARYYAQAQEAIRARDEFLSIASHELRTPLQALQLQLQLLTDLRPDERHRVGIDRAISNTKRLGKLIENLLDVSRITLGKLTLNLEAFDLVDAVSSVVDRFEEPAAVRTGGELKLEAPGPIVGEWDRLRVEQVMANLLDNALKYAPRRPVEVLVAATDKKASITVRDHGPGIAPEDIHRIFERFERAVQTRHYGGLGLGLYITRQIVEAHGGSVSVESQPGAGSLFRIELPLRPPRSGEGSGG